MHILIFCQFANFGNQSLVLTDRTYVLVNIPKYYLVPLPKRPPEHLLLPDKQFSMLAPKPPSDPSKLPPLCRIFEGRTSKILLDFAAILGTHET
jgi:hypothetical protein